MKDFNRKERKERRKKMPFSLDLKSYFQNGKTMKGTPYATLGLQQSMFSSFSMQQMSRFRVEPAVARRLPHRPVLAVCPHTVLQKHGFAKTECTTLAGGRYQKASRRCIRSHDMLPWSRSRRFNQYLHCRITCQRNASKLRRLPVIP